MPAATGFDDPNAREDEDEELREGEVDPSWDSSGLRGARGRRLAPGAATLYV